MQRELDLLQATDEWTTWSPGTARAPVFIAEREPPALAMEAAGDPLTCGCWRRRLNGLRPRRRYRVQAEFLVEDGARPANVLALITCEQNGADVAYEALDPAGCDEAGWRRVAYVMCPEPNARGLKLNLYFAGAAQGRVRWRNVRIEDVTDDTELRRIVALAAVSGAPQRPKSKDDLLDFYADRVDAIGPKGPDLIVLPEVINWSRALGSPADMAEPVPGPTSERFAEMARTYDAHIALSLYQRDGDAVYNAGLLIDRMGSTVGVYHKTHLPLGEWVPDGVTPGQDYPVFEVDFGRVAFMICWDYHFPEVARLYALQGADVLVNCNMGDGREERRLWEHMIRARAVDNHLHIAAAVNSGQSCIVSPRGEMLSLTDRTPGSIAFAECDLGLSVRNHTGRDIRKRYLWMRRPETYGGLVRSVWDAPAALSADW